MQTAVVLVIGAALGFLGAVGIYFEPKEPHKPYIVAAGTLRGLLVALLTGLSISGDSSWLVGLGFGALYGTLFGGVIYLAKGGPRSGDAPFVIPMSAATGSLTGVLITWLAF